MQAGAHQLHKSVVFKFTRKILINEQSQKI